MRSRRALTVVAVLAAMVLALFTPAARAATPNSPETAFAFGDAAFYGSTAGIPGAPPLVGIAATPTGHGYWLAAADGAVFSFGDAHFYGSMGNRPLAEPIVGIAATPTGNGYWLVASDGGVFAFGDARYYGSAAGLHLAGPITAIAATPTGNGYWLAASDGGVFSFGDAHFYGSAAPLRPVAPVTAIAATPSGNGYWLAAADGGVFTFGHAGYYGSASGLTAGRRVVGIDKTPTGAGYWLVASTAPVAPVPTPTPPLGVQVYYGGPATATDCAAVYPLSRVVQPPQVLAGAMTALLAGPTAGERAAGYTSFFSSATAGMLNWAHVDSTGLARIDFANFSSIIPNASTSCGSSQLLSELNHTAMQFASVKAVVYSFNGSVAAFYNWLQLASPTVPAATTPTLSAALVQASGQEHNLAATYANVIAALGPLGPFPTVATAESRHVDTVEYLAANHAVTLPSGPFAGQPAPSTLTAACQLAAGLEQSTIGMYSQLMPQMAAWPDVIQGFSNLQAAASQHLAAFQRCS